MPQTTENQTIKNIEPTSVILSIFLGTAIPVSLSYLLNLPVYPWLFFSIFLILIAIGFIFYLAGGEEFVATTERQKIRKNFFQTFQLICISLLSFFPFCIMKAIQKVPDSNFATTELWKGGFSFSLGGLVIYSCILAVSFLVLGILDNRDGWKKFVPFMLFGLLIIAGLLGAMIKV